MQSAVRDLQSSQRKAATKMREALGELQQAEIQRDMQRNADWIRRGMGGYAVMSEATITQGINELREQLKQVQQAMGQGMARTATAARTTPSSPNRPWTRWSGCASRWSR